MNTLPKHVAIICDGNRRWARAHTLSETAGHAYAADHVFFALVERAARMHIPYITFWILSTENEKRRSKQEMSTLFHLMRLHFKKDLPKLQEKKVRVLCIGNRAQLPEDLQQIITTGEQKTKDNDAVTAIFALNYGGRDEMMRAIKKIIREEKAEAAITEAVVTAQLDTAGIPDPEIVIRTGGEYRLSGFLLWQSAYSELFFTDTLFPDFTDNELEKIITDFTHRERRLGR